MNTHVALLVLAALAVGVLHTMVPDHWAPIALLSRQRGWSAAQTAKTAAIAGLGHTGSTLVIALAIWIVGAALAQRFGNLVSLASSVALISFGLWIAVASWREIGYSSNGAHEHAHLGHAHAHRHAEGPEHRHWHEHHQEDWHVVDGNLAIAPLHEHEHKTSSRTALLLILGSSPMVEGIPAFFAASRYGIGLLLIMSAVFAGATIATYVVFCVASARGMQRINLGKFEEYGEVISGLFIAVIGVVFLVWSGLP